MIRYAVGTTNLVYQSIDVEGRPAVDCFRIVTADERTATILNWGESETFFQSIRAWLQTLPTKKTQEDLQGICRDEEIQEMLRQYLAYERKFVPPPTEKQIKTEQMEWSE